MMPSTRHDDVYIPSHKRSRSRSPIRHSSSKRPRSRSPAHKSHHHHRHHNRAPPSVPKPLPYSRTTLHKHDLDTYEALFAEYLVVQKNIGIYDLTREEVKGRWKSFFGKWNRAELAEGWYDPAFGKRCEERHAQSRADDMMGENEVKRSAGRRISSDEEQNSIEHGEIGGTNEQVEDAEDGYGPAPPDVGPGRSRGPVIPRLQDLQERREQLDDEHEARRADMRAERKHERQIQNERLGELVPRAEPGTQERQLEKKREVAASNRAFKDAKEAGDMEVKEGELMGDDGIEAFKAEKKKREKVKNEREIRKEEVLRARVAEREERMAQLRGKEERRWTCSGV